MCLSSSWMDGSGCGAGERWRMYAYAEHVYIKKLARVQPCSRAGRNISAFVHTKHTHVSLDIPLLSSRFFFLNHPRYAARSDTVVLTDPEGVIIYKRINGHTGINVIILDPVEETFLRSVPNLRKLSIDETRYTPRQRPLGERW